MIRTAFAFLSNLCSKNFCDKHGKMRNFFQNNQTIKNLRLERLISDRRTQRAAVNLSPIKMSLVYYRLFSDVVWCSCVFTVVWYHSFRSFLVYDSFDTTFSWLRILVGPCKKGLRWIEYNLNLLFAADQFRIKNISFSIKLLQNHWHL